MLALVTALTPGRSFIASEAVASETPAAAASPFSVTLNDETSFLLCVFIIQEIVENVKFKTLERQAAAYGIIDKLSHEILAYMTNKKGL